jgi:hypothetical protein
MRWHSALVALPLVFIMGCPKGNSDATPATSATAAPSAAPSASAAAAPKKYASLDRAAFNRAAVRLDLPVYWVEDTNKDGAVDADEIATLLFYPMDYNWLQGSKLSPTFDENYAKMLTPAIPEGLPPAEAERRKKVLGELDNAAPTLVNSDMRKLSDEDKTFVRQMLDVGKRIDGLYATQKGSRALAPKVPRNDPASESLFRRSWGPECLTPGFDKDKDCTAIAGVHSQPVDIYPLALQEKADFCADLEKHPQSKKLLDPFVVVREKAGKLEAVPYSEAYKEQMAAISLLLMTAADGLKNPREEPLRVYLKAAAKAFTTNDWNPADEAWSKMNAVNSAWYVRIGPDETYWEPCSHKAGFHMTFARINPDSLRWQEKLSPVQQEMEDSLAALIGAPYKARKVTFHLPDFIDITTNSGDDRNAVGATIGQSLPNWGPVAAAGRGRTVAMSNLYTDKDSLLVRHSKVNALFGKPTADLYVDEAEPGLVSTILHEAAHNLGPAHQYEYKGKTDAAAFGGDLASMLEELKAQTAALWYVSFTQKKGILSPELARKVYLDSIVWAFNHVSRGMWTASHQRKHYSQLAAIQLGFLMDEKALVFEPDATAANGKDKGAYRVDFDKLPAAIDRMMKVVGGIKASTDKAAAEALSAKYVDGLPDHHARIAERCLRFPQPNFVYSVQL